MMNINQFCWIGDVVILIALVVFAALVRYYLPSYVKEKGKNLATKEDIGEITAKIESVKTQYARDLELLRVTLGSKAHVHQIRYEREYDILLELTQKIVKFRVASMALHPIGNVEDSEETRCIVLKHYREYAADFFFFIEERRPFFPEELYSVLQRLADAAYDKAAPYSQCSSIENLNWDQAKERATMIQGIADEAVGKIRERVRLWEKVDLS